jgi:hypothetical protein
MILSQEQQSSPCSHELGTLDFMLMIQELISMRAALSSMMQPEELGNLEYTMDRTRNKHPHGK